MRHVHSDRVQRWLGVEQAEALSRQNLSWYGPPIRVCGVPGEVYVNGDGEFVGQLRGGYFACAADAAAERIKRRLRAMARLEHGRLNAISTFADLFISGRTRRQGLSFSKTLGGGLGQSFSTWSQSAPNQNPPAGTTGGAAPGGTAYTSASTGAFPLQNPTVGKTQFVGGVARIQTASPNTGNFLLFDRLFAVAKTINSTATEAVTGVPTRYQNTVAGAADSAEGNFLCVAVGGTSLANTAHNWTVCTYTDQSGNTGATLPSVTGIQASSSGVVDMQSLWFAPLASGDTGIQKLTQMQCSALVATGAIEFIIGHPIGWLASPSAQADWIMDTILGGFNMNIILDNACLSLLSVLNPASLSTTMSGQIEVVQG